MVRAVLVCAAIVAWCSESVHAQPKGLPEPVIALADNSVSPAQVIVPEAGSHSSLPASSGTTDKHALLQQKLAELNCLQSEIDALRVETGTPQQILIKVKAIEVSRTKMRQLGIDFAFVSNDPKTQIPRHVGENLGLSSGSQILDKSSAFFNVFDALQQKRIARVLAEPSMVVVSGRSAQFRVGGELALPAPAGGANAVEYKFCGSEIDVLAVAKGENRVVINLRANLSELDESRSIEVGGMRMPSISQRQIDTSVELELGQTMLLSGLLESRQQQPINGKTSGEKEVFEHIYCVTAESFTDADLSTQKTTAAASYRTANSDSAVRPGERSVRVNGESTR